jgi:hypothetical protein
MLFNRCHWIFRRNGVTKLLGIINPMARVAIITMLVATEKLPINNISATHIDRPIPAMPRHGYLN